MARSDRPVPIGGRPPPGPLPTSGRLRPDASPTDVIETWDPGDDETVPGVRHAVQWDWHGRASWGYRAVAAYPVVAVVLAVVLVAWATSAAQGAIDRVDSVAGAGGATLLSTATPSADAYQNVTFTRPSGPSRPIQGSTSLALPPYVGWEANGSAGPANGSAIATAGLLHVGIRRPTTDFRGWFLTTTGTTPAACVSQFAAASPPAVTSPDPTAVGELVMAVQTSSTVTTGDINYVLVAENVYPGGRRSLVVGYSLGHLSHATEHILKVVPWAPGPLQVSIGTNGGTTLRVWIDGILFFEGTGLNMGIVPPFQPYLEVQERQTPYAVAYASYSSVCQGGLAVSNLPDGSVARLGDLSAIARGGSAVLPADTSWPPVTGTLDLSLPGAAHPVPFARHTYWPGSRYAFAPGA